ncbi:Hypothetical predicted protein [Olea europaea subsp. europaea]|uniref:Uncharacterized protein n=1 Tax=Olea europaea subsp. europaea TaxID=158383 RepID=A0A8S0U284_OLEEU|nr:Hypothetical predicted protein [Olea europaea subsp. europaea]
MVLTEKTWPRAVPFPSQARPRLTCGFRRSSTTILIPIYTLLDSSVGITRRLSGGILSTLDVLGFSAIMAGILLFVAMILLVTGRENGPY